MPGVGMQELCCLFCCPPLPSRIAAKLAFLPPNPPTYELLKQQATVAEHDSQQQCSENSSFNSGGKKSERCDDQAHLIPPPRPPGPPCVIQDGAQIVPNGDPLSSLTHPSDATALKEASKHRGAPGHDSNGKTSTHPRAGSALGKMIRSKTHFLTGRAGGGPQSADGGRAEAYPSFGIHLSQRAEWQYSGGKELDRLEACTAVTARGHVIPCLMVRCGPPLPGPGSGQNLPENSADAPSMPEMLLGPGSSPFINTTNTITTKGRGEVLLESAPPPTSSPVGSKSGGSKRGAPKSSPTRAKPAQSPGLIKSSKCRTNYAPTKYTLLFSHGNAVDLGQMSGFYLGLGSRLGCDVLGYDYTGYGASRTLKQAAAKDKGGGGHQQQHGRCRPSEADLYADAEAAWKALKIKFKVPHDRIILYGQSIGTVPTIHLAAKFDGTEPPAGVILHSPLTSGLRVAFPFVLPSTTPSERDPPRGRRQPHSLGDAPAPPQRQPQGGEQNFLSDFDSPRGVLGCLDAFATMDKVRLIIRSPTLVIHGTDDEVIDHSHGRAIHANLPRPVDPLWVRGAGHNDIELHTEFLVRLKKFIREELNTPL